MNEHAAPHLLKRVGAGVSAASAHGKHGPWSSKAASPDQVRPPPPVNSPAGLSREAFDPHMHPAMTPGEALTLAWYASQASVYVEYGSGASTVQAAPLARKALSIENSMPWCRDMMARVDMKFWIAQGKLRYECVDVGETGKG